jgi:hypothetical protein
MYPAGIHSKTLTQNNWHDQICSLNFSVRQVWREEDIDTSPENLTYIWVDSPVLVLYWISISCWDRQMLVFTHQSLSVVGCLLWSGPSLGNGTIGSAFLYIALSILISSSALNCQKLLSLSFLESRVSCAHCFLFFLDSPSPNNVTTLLALTYFLLCTVSC